MPDSFPQDSVGLVQPHTLHVDQPLELECGRSLPAYDLVYETYGSLNADASNAVLICHALSGHHHAAGYHSQDDKRPGWWESCIGPGKPIDTDRFFVVCPNNLGGCHGSSGPTSLNPDTGQPWGPDFPMMTGKDWVKSQTRLADAPRMPQARERVFAVNVVPVRLDSVIPVMTAFGEVQSRRTLELRSAVGGTPTELAPELVEGGRVKAGALLARIDPVKAAAGPQRGHRQGNEN